MNIKLLKKYIPAIISVFSVFIFIFSAISVYAVCNDTTHKDSVTGNACISDYVPLVPGAFAGFDTSTASGNSFADFIGKVFQFGIAAAVALALIMIIWGGIEYMTTDSWQHKESGMTRIQDALWGLGLAFVSYIILNTINPCLVDFTGSKGCSTKNSFLTVPTSQSSQTQTPTFSELFNSQTGTLQDVGSQAASQQIIINNAPPTVAPAVVAPLPGETGYGL